MSPPEAPAPPKAFGWPRYSACWQAFAPGPPRPLSARQASEPLPTPRSDPRNTSLILDTWIDGSPSTLVPQPFAPTLFACGWPNENVELFGGTAAVPTAAPPASPAATSTAPPIR